MSNTEERKVEAAPSEEEAQEEEEVLKEEEEDFEEEDEEEDMQEPQRDSSWPSGWEDASTHVEADPEPHATPEREILWACENGKQSLVEEILKNCPEAISSTDSDGYTSMHRAAYSNYPEIIKVLLHAGASVSAQTADGWTALHSACRWNHVECADVLIDGGCDVNSTTNSGQTPLHVAATNPQARETLEMLLMHPLVKPLLTNDNGETAKDIAMRSGPFEYLFEVTDPVLNTLEEQK